MTKTTLITFLGGNRGKDPSQPTYAPARYQFPGAAVEETDYFAEALRRQRSFAQVVVLGSRTSIWEKLADDAGDEDLALAILEQTEERRGGAGICDAHLQQLQERMTQRWQQDVLLYAGEVSVTAENAQQEMLRYVEVLQQVTGDEVLLDFTHGFRSMPMLLNSALQFWQALRPRPLPVRLVYGELNRHGPSPVHFLDDIQTTQQVARAVRLFFEKLDGTELATQVQEFWPSGQKALAEITLRLQENRLNQMEQPLRQLRNSLEKMANPAGAPPWFAPVKVQLTEWVESLLGKTLPVTLWNLAKELAQNGLMAQAVIALDEALLEAILSAQKQSASELTSEEMKDRFREAMQALDPQRSQELWQLHHLRNYVAHGGRKDSKQQREPAGSPSKRFDEFHQLLKPIVRAPQDTFPTV
jgi:CRISPR-associated Csx2 family protein